MQLESIRHHVVAVPPPYLGGRYWIFVVLRTACGIEGVGEVYAGGFHPRTIGPLIDDVFERLLLGRDPHQVERFTRAAYSSGFTQRPDLTMAGITSGLEMACWDIIGKAANRPVYDLLGGRVHERLRSYTYLYPRNAEGVYDYEDPRLAAECAAQMADRGFTAVKFDPAGPYTVFGGHQLSLGLLAQCETFCRLIREAVGGRCDLLIGTHGQMTPAGAVRLARRLERYDPLWFEEPVPPDDFAALGTVAGKTTIPVAAGERLATLSEFHQLLDRGRVAIAQMNLGRVGGLLEGKKVAALAQAYGAQIAPHLYNGPVGAAASIQMGAASPNFLIQESIVDFGGFHAQLLKQPLQWEEGFLIPPTAPGLGVELDMDVVRAHSPYTGGRLHIEMDPEPFDVGHQSSARWQQRWSAQ